MSDEKKSPDIVTPENLPAKVFQKAVDHHGQGIMNMIDHLGKQDPALGLAVMAVVLSSIIKCFFFMARDKGQAKQDLKEMLRDSIVSAEAEWPKRKAAASEEADNERLRERLILPKHLH